MSFLDLACAKLGVTPHQIMAHRVTPDEIIVVVDMGISGAPKHTISLAELTPETITVAVDEPATAVDVTAVSTDDADDVVVDLTQLKKPELVQLAKDAGISNPQKLTKAVLIERLTKGA